MKVENKTLTPQEARAELREVFLKVVGSMRGRSCKILTYEKTKPSATFLGWKPDGTEVLVSDLKTPANIDVPTALLRSQDIIAIHFDNTDPVESQ